MRNDVPRIPQQIVGISSIGAQVEMQIEVEKAKIKYLTENPEILDLQIKHQFMVLRRQIEYLSEHPEDMQIEANLMKEKVMAYEKAGFSHEEALGLVMARQGGGR
jgi:hypothetical protein